MNSHVIIHENVSSNNNKKIFTFCLNNVLMVNVFLSQSLTLGVLEMFKDKIALIWYLMVVLSYSNISSASEVIGSHLTIQNQKKKLEHSCL